MNANEGAIRKRPVPSKFISKNVRDKEIVEWARNELNGQEPEFIGHLRRNELFKKIKTGEITEVTIKPKKPGFFLPDGRFIEALKFSPELGDDLKQAEERWDLEEKNNEWADHENQKFNKTAIENSQRVGALLWEHGKRIEDYASVGIISAASILHLLGDRPTSDSYSRHTHQTSLDFYRWKPNLTKESPLLDWSWERIDTVLRFSIVTDVRDYLTELLEITELGELSDEQLARLLGVKRRKLDLTIKSGDLNILSEIRGRVKGLEEINQDLLSAAISIVVSQNVSE